MQQKSEFTLQLIKEFGLQVKAKRKKLNKSQRLLSFEYDLDSGNLSRIEAGLIDPKLTMLWRISEALGIPLSKLIKSMEDSLGKDFHITEL